MYVVSATLHLCLAKEVPDGISCILYCSKELLRPILNAFSDVGKVVNAPIFHVNGDDPVACIHLAKVAGEFRSRFHRDVVIDIICYRRRGHNEADQPMFTQPRMYNIIKNLKPIYETWSQDCVKAGHVAEADLKKMQDEYDNKCNTEFEASKKLKSITFKLWLDSKWKGFFKNQPMKYPRTGIPDDVLNTILTKFSEVPSGFNAHKGIEKILENRRQLFKNKITDFAMGEALAFGSLLKEGVHVRLSGEDVERGTFSHRHHVIHDQSEDGKQHKYVSLYKFFFLC